MVYILESSYFDLFEVWETFEACKARIERDNIVQVRPYGEGWNLYVEGRFSPVGLIRSHTILR